MIVTVDGLEMFANRRTPGSAVCDGCGLRVNSTREDLAGELEGWTMPRGFVVGEPAYCPKCSSPAPTE